MDSNYELYEYVSSKCKTYDHSTRSIHTSDLNRVCSHFKLDSRALLDTIKVDSQSRVSFSELHYAIYQETRLSPSMQQMPAPQPPPAQPPSHVHYHPRQPPPSSHNRRMSSHNLLYDYNIPFDETDDSFTPPKYTPDDYNQEMRGCISPTNPNDSRWSNPGSPPDTGGGHQSWETDYPTSRRGNYCTNCDYWRSRAQDLEKQLITVNRENDSLQIHVDRLQKELDYCLKATKGYKKEISKLKEENASDGGNASYFERQIEDLKRAKDDVEASLKHYKKHYSALKQENIHLNYVNREQQQNVWYLQDEKQRLETSQLQKDAKLDGYITDEEKQRNKPISSLPADNPDGSPSVFVVLGEDVSSSVLPETLSQEQHHQMICGLQNCHSIEELLRCLVSYGFGCATEDKSRGMKVDNDHLRSKVESLESKYNTLSSSFEAAKLETEEMFCKLSSVEANNCRLRHAVKLCQQACEVHEMLYEMKEAEARPPSTSSAFSPMEFDSPSRTTNHDLHVNPGGKNILTRARSLLKHMETNQELQSFLPTVHGKTSSAGWNLSMSQHTGTTGTTSGLSFTSSLGPEPELNSTEVEQLKVYYQALVCYSKHLLKTLIEIDGLQGMDTVKDPGISKDSISADTHGGRILDMEDAADTEELCKIREEKAELRSQIYMMEQSKRSMELQLSRRALHCQMLEKQLSEQKGLYQTERKKRHKLKEKMKLFKSENPHVPDWTEENEQIKQAWEAESAMVMKYEELFGFMQSHVKKSQDVTDKLVEFVKELLRANRALVEAFERAKKRQQIEKHQLKSELKSLIHHSTSVPATGGMVKTH